MMSIAKYVAVGLLVSTWIGCGDDSAAESEAPEAPETHGSETAVSEASGEDSPAEPAEAELADSTDPDEPAEAAYRAALEAYNRGDVDTYLSAFNDPMCAREGASLTRDELRSVRQTETGGVRVHALQPLHGSDDEVMFADFGVWYRMLGESETGVRLTRPFQEASDEAILQGTHQKLVVLRKDGDTWRIASETPLSDRSCISEELGDVAAPPEFARCAARHRAALNACDESCEHPSNSCNVCPEEALCGLLECLEMDPIPDVCG